LHIQPFETLINLNWLFPASIRNNIFIIANESNFIYFRRDSILFVFK